MNYLPLLAYWFIGALNMGQQVSYFDSFGLLSAAPAPPLFTGGGMMMMLHVGA